MTGEILLWPTQFIPSGYLPCAAQKLLIASYSSLAAAIAPTIGVFTADVTNNLIDCTAHGLSNGDIIAFLSTGTLPAPLFAPETRPQIDYYFVQNATTNTFQVGYHGLGVTGTVTLTNTGSGVHTLYATPWNMGTTTTPGDSFYIPDFRDMFPLGVGSIPLGSFGGEADHTLTIGEIPSHTHPFDTRYGATNFGADFPTRSNSSGAVDSTNFTTAEGGGGAHNNMPPYACINFIIKI